ncbi:hypothetical protein LXL04_015910 [Taraxacum kok-saghyz]
MVVSCNGVSYAKMRDGLKGGRSGVPARCAGDSFIRRMVSFRETERPAIFIPEGRLVVYPHNVTLTTYFRLKISSSKTRQKDSFTNVELESQLSRLIPTLKEL